MPEAIKILQIDLDDETVIRGVIDLLGTEKACDEPSSTFAERVGRCYELAGYAIAFGSAPAGSRLVHGSWHGPEASRRIGHAWLELPHALIWEPINAVILPEKDFYSWTRAWPEVTYTLPIVRRMIVSHGHFGRWHESRYP